VLAPTPPPDIDLHAWRDSLERIADWSPSRLAVTHFGAFDRVTSHLAELREHLEQLEALARGSDEAAFAAAIRARVRRSPGAEAAAVYEQATSPAQSFQGLKRYVSGLERAARPNTLAR
jgi:hypothetical protein